MVREIANNAPKSASSGVQTDEGAQTTAGKVIGAVGEATREAATRLASNAVIAGAQVTEDILASTIFSHYQSFPKFVRVKVLNVLWPLMQNHIPEHLRSEITDPEALDKLLSDPTKVSQEAIKFVTDFTQQIDIKNIFSKIAPNNPIFAKATELWDKLGENKKYFKWGGIAIAVILGLKLIMKVIGSLKGLLITGVSGVAAMKLLPKIVGMFSGGGQSAHAQQPNEGSRLMKNLQSIANFAKQYMPQTKAA